MPDKKIGFVLRQGKDSIGRELVLWEGTEKVTGIKVAYIFKVDGLWYWYPLVSGGPRCGGFKRQKECVEQAELSCAIDLKCVATEWLKRTCNDA